MMKFDEKWWLLMCFSHYVFYSFIFNSANEKQMYIFTL